MQNLLVLTGLGTSVEFGGPTMGELWDACVGNPPSIAATRVLTALNFDGLSPNIEELLSRCDAQLQASGDVSGIAEFRRSCILTIIGRCREVGSPGHDIHAHREFVRRLARRRARDPRLRLFTTNYDLCFERATGDLGLTTIDGFSFTAPRRFDPRFFDYDVVRRGGATDTPDYVAGVFHYLKIHGSVDWTLTNDGQIIIGSPPDADHACLIYPTRNKFQFSFQQPHLELMAQFMSAVREPNTCLLVIGFGFHDTHITEPILAAIETNPHLRVVVVSPRSNTHYAGATPAWTRLRSSFESGHDVGFIRAAFSEFVPLIPDLRVLTAGERIERDIREAARGID